MNELETCDDHRHNLWHPNSDQKIVTFQVFPFPPHRPESKVGVHQGVDEVVHGHEPAGAGGELAEAVEDIDEHRQVVIPGKFIICFDKKKCLTSGEISTVASLAR